MDTVRSIITAHGYASIGAMDIGDHIEIITGHAGAMPLVIEKIGDNRVSVAHYYTQFGDVMYDPEIVFRITSNGTWMAVEYTQHPDIYRHDETGLIDAYDFAVNTWDDNLRTQGYVAAARGEKQ